MLRGAGSLKEMRGTWWVSAEEQFTLVQIPNSHSLELKTVNNTVVEISLSFYEALNSKMLEALMWSVCKLYCACPECYAASGHTTAISCSPTNPSK